jgi:predicted metal-dependent hydrolase
VERLVSPPSRAAQKKYQNKSYIYIKKKSMSSKQIEIENLGKIHLRKNRRAKNISIRIKPFAGIIVTLPYYASYKSAEKFVKSKTEWIKKSLLKIKETENKQTLFDETTIYKTRKHQLKIEQNNSDEILIYLSKSTIKVKYPERLAVTSPAVQNAVRIGIIEALRKEAKEYLPARVEMLAIKYGFKYNKLFIKNLRSRWGSCSNKNNINLNLQLMRLPDKLIDYIILHELVHTKEKNHGKNFWTKLDAITGNAKALSNEVKKYSTTC